MVPALSGSRPTRSETAPISPKLSSGFVERVLRGEEEIICHHGTSQYGAGGPSSCGLAAMNCTRVILGKARDGVQDEELMRQIVSRDTMEEIMSISSRWSNDLHLEIEPDIFRVPIFETTLTLTESVYGNTDLSRLTSLMRELQASSRENCAAVVITRPPEIVACLRIPVRATDIFAIFDSHPRPRHPEGAAFTFSTSGDVIAVRLHEILAIDPNILMDSALQWQAQLLAHFSGHFFVSKPTTNTISEMNDSLLEASLTILRFRGEVEDFKSQNQLLMTNNRTLEAEIEELQDEVSVLKRQLKAATKDRKPETYNSRSPDPQPVAGPSQLTAWPSLGISQSSERSHRRLAPGPQIDPKSALPPPIASQSSHPSSNSRYNRSLRSAQSATFPPVVASDHDLAISLQQKFIEEDDRLANERKRLEKSKQIIFRCPICMDEYPQEAAATVSPCGHSFCRDCLRQHTMTKIDDRRFPILCPLCHNDDKPSVIEDELIQMLGIDEKSYAVLQDLQLAPISIFIQCPECKAGVLVDRHEYQASDTIVCPMTGKCNHCWCKTCQQPIEMGAFKHSCDGSSELKHLMKEQGWKSCPGCETPIQKASGCNHMICMAPGCNTHFCYRCGQKIIQSVSRREIEAALGKHYRACMLFEVPRFRH